VWPNCQNCVSDATLLQQINHVSIWLQARRFSATRLHEIEGIAMQNFRASMNVL